MMRVASIFKLLMHLILVFLVSYSCAIPTKIVVCKEEEKHALLDFKLSFTADPFNVLSTWNIDNPKNCCEWDGVGCDNRTGHVISINMFFSLVESNQLRPSLLVLHHLKYLDLRGTMLTMRIPEFIGSLTKLTELYLASPGFFGKVPPHLGNLTNLKTLLVEDFTSGLLFADNLQWLSRLSSLQSLDLTGVNLSNDKFWLSTLKMLPSLSSFACAYCSLPNVLQNDSCSRISNHSTSLHTMIIPFNPMTSLPDLSMFSSLEDLDASVNKINESLLAVLQHLPTTLSSLTLLYNPLKDVISDSHFTNFSNLQSLDLSYNDLLRFNLSQSWVPPFQLNTLMLSSCRLGPNFPNWILTQTNLDALSIFNCSISDTMPNTFWSGITKITTLILDHNKLQGTVPNLSVRFANLDVIDLSFNDFHGPIPLFMFSSRILDLSCNKFSRFPPFHHEVSTHHHLELIDLSDNVLSGSLPNWFFHFDELRHVNLADNMLSGTISRNIASFYQLSALHLNNNSFSGHLPSSMINCTQLLDLDLANNNFSGSVPYFLGDGLQELNVLRLRSNNFTGDLPSTLCNLQRLQVLDLSGNRILGSIPGCFDNFTSMTMYKDFNASYVDYSLSFIFRDETMTYLDHASIIWKGILASKSSTNLPQWNVIDLSNNCLTGKIPSGVTSLKYLRSLDLSRNKLDGSIPNKIGQLTVLEVLNLSSNTLSGEIPQSLADISTLDVFNLSSNNLSGRIPRSTQLQSFDPSSFAGNPKLCGEPLPTMFPGDEPPSVRGYKEEEVDNETFDFEALYAALGAGFACGLFGILGILNYHTPFRHAFFHMASEVGDWIFVNTFLCQSRIKRRLGY